MQANTTFRRKKAKKQLPSRDGFSPVRVLRRAYGGIFTAQNLERGAQHLRQFHKVNRVQVLRVITIKMEVDRHHGIWTIDSIGQPPPSVPLAIGYRAILDVT